MSEFFIRLHSPTRPLQAPKQYILYICLSLCVCVWECVCVWVCVCMCVWLYRSTVLGDWNQICYEVSLGHWATQGAGVCQTFGFGPSTSLSLIYGLQHNLTWWQETWALTPVHLKSRWARVKSLHIVSQFMCRSSSKLAWRYTWTLGRQTWGQTRPSVFIKRSGACVLF